MQTPDAVEAILVRLMPPALSDAGQRNIENMLDELMVEAPPVITVPVAKPRLGWWLGGIAAAGILAAWLMPLGTRPGSAPVAAAPAVTGPEVVLIGESGRIESMTDEGWQEDTDGAAMQAMRLNVVEEDSILDEETGIVMKISEPREEILLMPVNSF
jgi:hypothetical protein